MNLCIGNRIIPMLNKLIDFLFTTEVKPSKPTPSKQEVKQVVNDVHLVPRYPPFDNGVPVITIDQLVETQSELIGRIRAAFGYSPAEFDNMVMSVIRNYAAYVHLLPATSREHHNNAGGLFRLGLEIGFYALQAADGKIYSNKDTAERRRALHPKWVYATFVAGLCSEMYLPYTTMTILSKSGSKWPSVSKRLYDWAVENDSSNYYIHWTDNIASSGQSWQASPIYVLSMVLPAHARDYLNEGNEIIFSSMMNTIAGMSRHSDGNLIGELVRQYKDLIIDKDIKANPAFYGKLTVGSHLAPNVIDIMRELIKDGVWTVNSKNSRIWYTSEGCFIVWSTAFTEITNVMKKRNIAGTPSSPETMIEMLLNSNLIEAQRSGSEYWTITVPNSPKLMETIKIFDPTILFDKESIELPDISLLNPASHKPKVAEKVETPAVNKVDKLDPVKEVGAQVVSKETTPVAEAKVAISADETKRENKVEQKPQLSQGAKLVVVENKVEKTPQQVQHPHAVKNKPQQTPGVNQQDKQESQNILDQVSIETKRLLSAIRADMQAGKSEHPVWMTARGLVISRAEFESHGIPYIKVFDEMIANNWIVFDPDTKKPIYKTEKEGVKVSGYLVNRTIAIAMGFEDKNA